MQPTSSTKRLRLKRLLNTPQPVRLDWCEKAAASLPPGKAMHLCIGLWLTVSISKSPTIVLTRRIMDRVNISRYAATDALRELEECGLIQVRRRPGRCSQVMLMEPGSSIPLKLAQPT